MNTTELQRIKQRYNIVGNCDALNRALDVSLQVAPTDLSVLIVGESGVGKEIIPRVIHDNSPRRREKYFAINCGSIPEGTIDSELFGHEKGSFTGAIGESEGFQSVYLIVNPATIPSGREITEKRCFPPAASRASFSTVRSCLAWLPSFSSACMS